MGSSLTYYSFLISPRQEASQLVILTTHVLPLMGFTVLESPLVGSMAREQLSSLEHLRWRSWVSRLMDFIGNGCNKLETCRKRVGLCPNVQRMC